MLPETFDEKYDRILYIKDGYFYFERIEKSRISRVNWNQRKVIIDGMLDPTVKSVKKKGQKIYYYYHSGRNCYFMVN